MSAYIVNKETIDRIVTRIHGAQRIYSVERNYPTMYQAYKGDCSELGQNLWKLNVEAVNQRYGGNYPIKLYQYAPARNCAGGTRKQQVRVYKSLQCFLYQCSEGDVPETPLFQELERYCSALAAEIITELPEYEDAAWG